MKPSIESKTEAAVDPSMDCPCCRDGGRRDDDGTTVTVKEMELYESEDWQGLIALRKRILARHEEDPYCHLRLAEAYALAGEHGNSLAAAARGHAKDPEDSWVQDAVLNALFALGRTEEDFAWGCETPPVLRLDDRLMERVERCLERDDRGLDGHRGMVEVGFVYHRLQDEAYLPFGPEELLAAVREDGRFLVDGEPDNPWESYFLTEAYEGALHNQRMNL